MQSGPVNSIHFSQPHREDDTTRAFDWLYLLAIVNNYGDESIKTRCLAYHVRVLSQVTCAKCYSRIRMKYLFVCGIYFELRYATL